MDKKLESPPFDQLMNTGDATSEYHKEIQRVLNANRRYVAAGLPATLTIKQWQIIKHIDFNGRCPLTGSTNTVIEHFIPISWGHGTSCAANVYPIQKGLNVSKGSSNPFVWYRKNSHKLDPDGWGKLIKYLASQNNLTISQFEEFVYFCEKNKRLKEEIDEQKSTSLELYLKHKQRQLFEKDIFAITKEFSSKFLGLTAEQFVEYAEWCVINKRKMNRHSLKIWSIDRLLPAQSSVNKIVGE